ncbi:alpha/beta fold hydrolase [Streptomyces phyllanthi]|uniref:Alpha/beta hydrolase n=1 Tax=Streptomyces phyllanthi TaxID=1803180 RepID=A0A5N8WCN3_9ACTN|nr:alpha/beta hydrolase [Streptomyces phyllanthi]MPY45069.1 alpha/beta hydrolase [Streptomyces phyllanthi]
MPSELVSVAHRTVDVDGVEVFYREAGPADAPVVLLPHGYPSSSFQYRTLMPVLGDRWRLIAPDFPGFGYSETPGPDRFDYSFAGYARLLERFSEVLDLHRFALYLFDYGSQAGLQLAVEHPERIAALVIQNGDAYAETLGPKYAALKEYWADPTPERRAALAEAVTERGLREEVIGEVPAHMAELISPDLWELSWPVLGRSPNREIMVDLFADIKSSVDRFPEYQAYLRGAQPPALIVWGPHDDYMPEDAARAYLTDLPDAELHVLKDAGHWALETHLHEIAGLMREFLGRVHP